MKNQIDILGIKINNDSESVILEKIEKYIIKSEIHPPAGGPKSQKPLLIFTPNPEIVMSAQKDQQLREIVNSGQINIPDGAGLVWAGKIMGYPIRKRISGADLLEKISSLAEKEQVAIGLIGGFGNLALSALECLKKKYPKLTGWAEAGPRLEMKSGRLEVGQPKLEVRSEKSEKWQSDRAFGSPRNNQSLALRLDYGDWNIDEFIRRVKMRKTAILFVGFGCPKQEYFINEISAKLDNIVLMAVGGTFDYLSGRLPRAPRFMRSRGLEWLYRLAREPWRIKRQTALARFVLTIISVKLGIRSAK